MVEQLELSRRRVLIGAAWATPVVLVATAIPAAAASTTRGAVALTSLFSTMTSANLYVRGQVAYAGAGGPSPDAPVTNVQLQVTMLYSRITVGTAPVVSGTGWAFAGPYTTTGSGSSRTITYKFTWTGAQPLSAANPITPQLAVTFAKPTSVNNLDVAFSGRGVSLFTDVTAARTIGTTNVGTIGLTSTGNSVTFNSARGGLVTGTIPVYRLRGTVRNTGVTATTARPGAAKITGIKVTFKIPASALSPTLSIYPYSAGSIDAGWGTPAITLASGVYTIVYTYTPTAGPTGSTNTAILDVAIRAASTTKVVNAATIGAAGTSETFALTSSQVGPA